MGIGGNHIQTLNLSEEKLLRAAINSVDRRACTLSDEGLDYFKQNEALKIEVGGLAKPLQGDARELLLELISDQTGNIAAVLAEKFNGLNHNEDTKLRATINYLCRIGYLNIPKNGWADDVPYFASLTYEGEHYLSEEKSMIEMEVNGLITGSRSVFIVHGHDDAMKAEAARLVERLGYEAIILHEQPDVGKTIIEKLEQHSEKPEFAIILYSPDDLMDNGKKRARQNVVFEHGYFVGKLGRGKVVCLYKLHESFELPTDISGILYKPYDSNGAWKYEISREMKTAGLEIDLNKL